MPKKPIREAIIPIGPSIAYVELTQGQFARIDRSRAFELTTWNWYAHWEPDCNSFYAWRKQTKPDGKRTTISMQAQILGISGSGLTGDHIDRDPLNNMDYNLRAATQSEQRYNQSNAGRPLIIKERKLRRSKKRKLAGKVMRSVTFLIEEDAYNKLSLLAGEESMAGTVERMARHYYGKVLRRSESQQLV